MTKLLVLFSALVTAVVVAVTAALLLFSCQSAFNVHFGMGRAASVIFLPDKSRPELSIIRHRLPDGSAVDDVLMRDGTTKRIVYDRNMLLRQVFAYFKAGTDQVQGPPMYEKTHDERGHLASEKHLRLDGSVEMDGHYNPDTSYVRRLYYPSCTASAPPDSAPGSSSGSSPDSSKSPLCSPEALVVSAEQTFDKLWHHTSQTDFRLDGTRKLVHVWGDGADEVVTTLAADGKTIVSSEGTKGGRYYTAFYYPDSRNIKVDVLNSYEGTTFQFYRLDQAHTLGLKVTFDNSQNDQIVIPGPSGKPLINQVWSLDYSGKPVNGPDPRVLDHIDHFNDDGKVDIKYVFDRASRRLIEVTYYQGDTPSQYGARVIYTVGSDGFATSVKTVDANNKDDGGKPVAKGSKHFSLAPWMVTRPGYDLPKLKEGLKLYGEPAQEFFDVD